MIKNIVLGMLLLAGFSLSAQQKANYKLADRFTFKNFRYADRNSLSIYPEFINDGDCFWFSFTTEEGKKYYYVDPAKREKRLLFDTGKLLGQLSEETRKAYDTKDFTLQGVEFDKKRSSFTFVFEKNRYRYDMKTGLVEKVDTVISKGWGESWKKYSPG